MPFKSINLIKMCGISCCYTPDTLIDSAKPVPPMRPDSSLPFIPLLPWASRFPLHCFVDHCSQREGCWSSFLQVLSLGILADLQ